MRRTLILAAVLVFLPLTVRSQEMGKVVVYRTFLAVGHHPSVFCDGKEIGKLGRNQFVEIKAHEEETGKVPVLDPDFAKDVEEIVSPRKPWNPPAWE